VRGTTHLCNGQEACAVGMAAAMQRGDTLTCTYRGHGHALALGMGLRELLGELMGKKGGCCQGKGGSMHMTDAALGLLGANAIVGAQLPIAAGAALSAQTLGLPHVAVSFIGDGGTNIGAFHETLNLSAVWKLPVVLAIENNLYGEYSPLAWTTPIADLATRAVSYGIPGVVVDGQDVRAVIAASRTALARARRGDGPTLIEFKTYRFVGHSRTDSAPYRAAGELEQWKKRDPILLLQTHLGVSDAGLASLREEVRREVEAAVEWAKAQPYPDVSELTHHIFTA
jgi:pyruvate dehydrogenase E1 component alpha subunit